MKIVMIGNGMVGFKFCEKLVAKASKDSFDITVFGEEVRPAYDRVHLSEFFSGKLPGIYLLPPLIGILPTRSNSI
jgi:nitrite reductase (NADH) large subunit